MQAKGWLARVKSLGQALLELLSAEAAVLGSELRVSARQLRTGAVLLAVAAFFGFWTVGALAYAVIELLTFWLPRWGAVLACTGGFALLTLVFVLLGRARLRRLESPVQTVTKRIESHNAWVRDEVLPGPDPEQRREP